MALQKQITDADGSDSSYWRISGFKYNADADKLTITVQGWKNETYRNDDSANPLKTEKHQYVSADFPSFNFTMPTLYDKLKERDEFDGATDV